MIERIRHVDVGCVVHGQGIRTNKTGAATEPVREVGSSVWQVFEGSGSVVLNGETRTLAKGDLFVVPSWQEWSLQAGTDSQTGFDLFRFSDAPIFERLNFNRTYIEGRNK